MTRWRWKRLESTGFRRTRSWSPRVWKYASSTPDIFKTCPAERPTFSDCQWLQRLHSAGLLRGSFRPPQEVCVLRSLARHRDNLIHLASTHVLHMQKALDQMNVQVHHVLSDITGLSGLAILDAIVAGERNPRTLAGLRDGRVQASEEKIIQALTGDYRPEHVFTLKQSLAAYRYYQRLMAACDLEIEQQLKGFDAKVDVEARPEGRPKYGAGIGSATSRTLT